MQVTSLERSILAWLAARYPEHRSLAGSEIVSREATGTGFYCSLQTEESPDWDRPPLRGPEIESPLLEAGGGCLLWLSGGKPACLEIFAYGDEFPDDLSPFDLVDGDAAPR